MRTIITFLNDKGLKEGTFYSWNGVLYEGGVFSLALRQFVEHDRMLVCNTPEAAKNTYPALQALNDSRITPVDIPKGENTNEMWEIFNTITSHVNTDETVIFDITHGLRSLPFLVFLFAAYLKFSKNVTIEAIYYGAFELGKPAPIIDLSEFVGMLDWITATDQFVQTGDAQRLANLLNPVGKAGNATKKAAKTLSDVSLATFLCQPLHLANVAKNLEADLAKAQEELLRNVAPFEMLRQRITETFSGFVGDFEANPQLALQSQLRLVRWYSSNSRLIEAMTLAREWLINAVAYRLNIPFSLKLKIREKLIARAISGIEMVSRQALEVEELNEYGRIIYDSWSEKDKLVKLWNVLQPVRNALDHAGHQEGAMSIANIIKKVNNDVIPLLIELASLWKLVDEEIPNNLNLDS
jgi:CRISPR-associated Csx2 family protein